MKKASCWSNPCNGRLLMALLSTNLILSGTLFLSPAHPAVVNKPGASVWFSSSKIIEAQSSGKSLVLRAKIPGLVHAFGLSSDASSTLRIQSISDDSYVALEKCPQAPLDWSRSPPTPRKTSDSDLDQLANCGFDALAIPEALRDTWETRFGVLDSRLESSGLRILGRPLSGLQHELNHSGNFPKARLKKILGGFFPFYSFHTLEGPRPGRTLIFEVSLFEFSRSKAAALGLRWPESIALKSLESGRMALVGAAGKGFEIGADFGESMGVGRVLARPQIRTKPGEKATFQSGGEIPIRHATAYSNTTMWKEYGLIVALEPDAQVETGAPEITVGFKLELSEPDPSTAIDGVPGMRVRRLESRFDLRVNEMTVLTTLVQTRSGSDSSGLYGLSSLSLVEALFGHKSRSEQDSELWFSIRPSWEEIHAR